MEARCWRVVVAVALLGASFLAACSSSAQGPLGNRGRATTGAALDLGVKDLAAGAPYKVGFVTPGTNPLGDGRNEIDMAQATAKYVNDYLGGIAGHPLELDICQDHTTGAGAAACANQMLADKVPAVLMYTIAQPGPFLNLLTSAKVPVFAVAGGDQTMLTSPITSVLSNPIAFLAAPLRLARERGLKKIAMVYVDVGAAASLPSVAKSLYGKNGVDLTMSKVPVSAADVTPQIQAAISWGADALLVLGSNGLCVSALKAVKALAFTGPVIANNNCLKTDAGKTVGGFDGLVVGGENSTSDRDAQVRLFHQVAKTYAPSIKDPDGGAVPGQYSAVLGFARAMKALRPNQFTALGVSKALLTMAPAILPLFAGQTFQCDRKKSALLGAACTNVGVLETTNAYGNVIKEETFDAPPSL